MSSIRVKHLFLGFILALAMVGTGFSDEPNLNHIFKDITCIGKTITLRFQNQGVKYAVILNEDTFGVSGYNEKLTLNQGDALRLIHKHGTYKVVPVFEESGTVKLDVTETIKDGKEKTEKHYTVDVKVQK